MSMDSARIGDTAMARQRERQPAPRVNRFKLLLRFVITALALFIVFGGLYFFNLKREQGIAQYFATLKPPPAPIVAAEATTEAVPRFLSGIGTIYAVHAVTVAPEVGGRILHIFFQPGATVHAGDPLVQLNDHPEQADLANFRAQARLAGLNVARNKELVSRQAAAQATLDLTQSQLDEANAGIAKTEAQIAQKLVRAPFDGVLGIRQVELGQYVNAGAPMVTLTDLSTLYVNFTLPEQSQSQIALGQAVRFTVDAFPERSFEAQITTIEPQIGTDTRTIKVQATMPNPKGLLRPGMFANVRVVLPPQPDTLTVPETAIDYTLYGDSVFVVRQEGQDADGKPLLHVKRTLVKTGERFNNRVAIVSGLNPGDRVAASGQLKLSDGAPVRIITSNTLATPSTIPTN